MVVVLTGMIAANGTLSITYAKENTFVPSEQAKESQASFVFESAKKQHVQFSKAFEEIPKTMELWVKLNTGNTKRQVLLGNYVTGKNCFSLELTTTNQLRYVEYAYENGAMISSIDIKGTDQEVATGEWMLLSLIRDPKRNQIQILKNGEIIKDVQLSGNGTDTLMETVPLDTVHYLGTDGRKQFFLDGEMSEVRLWNQAKSKEAILADMNQELKGTEEGLQHAYALDINALNATNPVIKDKKTNGINATAMNFTLPDAPVYEKEGTDFSKNDKDLEMMSLPEEIPMTLETWVKLDTDKAGTRSIITGNYYDSYYDGIPLMNFEITAKGEPRLYWNINKVATDYKASGVNVYTGTWTHIAITCGSDPSDADRKLFSTYINGELMHQQSLKFTPVKLTQPMKIGEDSRYAHYFKGSMADLRMWSTTRTAEEIKANFNHIVETDAAGLLGNWTLNEAENGGFRDRSIHNNDAVPYWLDGDLMKKAEDGYETIAVIPDTQTMSYGAPTTFTTMTTWLKDHADELGIKFAIHLGDIVNDNGDQNQWNHAKASMSVLDGVIPYVFSAGNHDTALQKIDGIWWGKRDTTMMNRNFPYDKFANQENFGGAYQEGVMDNTYSFFTVNNVNLMTISLEQNSRDEVLAWANQLAEEHKDKKIIVTTHEYMSYDGKPTTEATQDHLKFVGGSNPGTQLWEKFGKKHENIIAIMSGHVGYPDLIMNEAKGEHGNTVQQILCDAQFMDRDDINNGSKKGLGMIMLLSFKEGSNDVSVNWYSTVRQQYFRINNQFISTLELNEEQSISKKLLHRVITKAQSFIKSEQFASLPLNVQAMLNVRLKEAKKVYENAQASDEACITAWKQMADALQYADFKADKSMLKDLIELCEAIDLSKYGEGVEVFEAALASAKEVVANDEVLQDTINVAYDTLLEAQGGLKEKPVTEVDKQLLNYAVELARETISKKDAYIQNDAWNAFEAAFKEAEAVMNNKEADQAMVDNAVSKLLNAYEDIRLLPSEEKLSQLEDFLDIIAQIERTLYSMEELARIDEAADKAQRMLADQAFSDEEYTVFASTMGAITNLIEQKQSELPSIKEQPDDETEYPIIKENTDQSKAKTNEATPKTGDATNAGALMGLLAASSVILLASGNKKRKYHNL